MKRTITALTIAAAFAITSVSAVAGYQQDASKAASADEWERMALSDACTNGDVPALGYYQTSEDES